MPGRVNPTYGTSLLAPQAGGGGVANPLEMMRTMAQTQEAMIGVQQRGAQLQARNRFGEIYAGPGTPEEKFNQAMSDPLVAGFAPELINTMRQTALTSQQIAEIQLRMGGEQMSQAKSGFEAINRALMTVRNDPNVDRAMAERAVNTQLSFMPDYIRKLDGPAVQSVLSSVFDGTEGMSPDQRIAHIQSKIDSNWLGAGLGPDALYDISGTMRPQIQWITDPAGRQIPYRVGGLPFTQPPGAPAAPGAPSALAPTAPGVGAPMGRPAPGLPIQPSKEFIQSREDVGGMSAEVTSSAQLLNQLQDALEHFQAGRGAEFRNIASSMVENWGEAAGVDQKTVDGWVSAILHGGDQAAFDKFMELKNQYAVRTLKQSMSGTGRVMRPEVDAFMSAFADTTNPRALWDLINDQGKLMLQRASDMANQFYGPNNYADQFMTQRTDQDFRTWYNNQKRPRGLFPTQVGDQSLAPRDPSRLFRPTTDRPAGPQRPPLGEIFPPR